MCDCLFACKYFPNSQNYIAGLLQTLVFCHQHEIFSFDLSVSKTEFHSGRLIICRLI